MDLSSLDSPFSEVIRTTVFHLASDKALGPNGIPTFFYQSFWEVIMDDLVWLLNDFADGNVDISRINHSQE